jgi:hypothetical protein
MGRVEWHWGEFWQPQNGLPPQSWRGMACKKQSKKSELLAHFLIGIFRLFISEKSQKNSKNSLQQPSCWLNVGAGNTFLKVFCHFSVSILAKKPI